MDQNRDRIYVGDKVRDNLTLEEGKVTDLRTLGEWLLVITVILSRSGIKKTYQVLKNHVSGTLTPLSRGVAESGQQILASGEKIIVDASADLEQIVKWNDTSVKPGWNKLRLYIDQAYETKIGLIDRAEMSRITALLETMTPHKLGVFRGLINSNPLIEGSKSPSPEAAIRKVILQDASDSYSDELVKTLAVIIEEHPDLLTKGAISQTATIPKTEFFGPTTANIIPAADDWVHPATSKPKLGSVDTQLDRLNIAKSSVSKRLSTLRNELSSVKQAGSILTNRAKYTALQLIRHNNVDLLDPELKYALLRVNEYDSKAVTRLTQLARIGNVDDVTRAVKSLAEAFTDGRRLGIPKKYGTITGSRVSKIQSEIGTYTKHHDIISENLATLKAEAIGADKPGIGGSKSGGYNLEDWGDELQSGGKTRDGRYKTLADEIQEDLGEDIWSKSLREETGFYRSLKARERMGKHSTTRDKGMFAATNMQEEIARGHGIGKPIRVRHGGVVFDLEGINTSKEKLIAKPANIIQPSPYSIPTKFTSREDLVDALKVLPQYQEEFRNIQAASDTIQAKAQQVVRTPEDITNILRQVYPTASDPGKPLLAQITRAVGADEDTVGDAVVRFYDILQEGTTESTKPIEIVNDAINRAVRNPKPIDPNDAFNNAISLNDPSIQIPTVGSADEGLDLLSKNAAAMDLLERDLKAVGITDIPTIDIQIETVLDNLGIKLKEGPGGFQHIITQRPLDEFVANADVVRFFGLHPEMSNIFNLGTRTAEGKAIQGLIIDVTEANGSIRQYQVMSNTKLLDIETGIIKSLTDLSTEIPLTSLDNIVKTMDPGSPAAAQVIANALARSKKSKTLPIFALKQGGGIGSLESPAAFKQHLTNIEKALLGEADLFAFDIETDTSNKIYNIGAVRRRRTTVGGMLQTEDVLDIGTQESLLYGKKYTPRLMQNEAALIEELASKIVTQSDDTLFLLHNKGFDIGMLTQRAKDLGLGKNVIKSLQTMSDRSVDTLMLSKIMKSGMPGGYSLQNLSRKLGIRSAAWTEEHIGLFDARTTMDLFNKLSIDKPTVLDQAGNFNIFKTTKGGSPKKLSAGSNMQYLWGIRERRLFKLYGWDAEDLGGSVRVVMQELNEAGEPIANRIMAPIDSPVHALPDRLLGEFKPVNIEEGLQLRQGAVEDLARNRIRKMMYEVDLPYKELERLRVLEEASGLPNPMDYFGGMEDDIAGLTEDTLAVRDAMKFTDAALNDPRLADQIRLEKNWLENEWIPKHSNIHDQLVANETLAPWQKNLVLRKYYEDIESVAPWAQLTDVNIPAHDRRLAFTIKALGDNPQSIRIASDLMIQSDIRRIALQLVNKADSSRLNEILAEMVGIPGGLDVDDLKTFLTTRKVDILSNDAEERLIESMLDNEILEAYQSNRTKAAKAIDPENYSNLTGRKFVERLQRFSKGNLNASEQQSLETTASFNEYLQSRQIRQNALKNIQTKTQNEAQLILAKAMEAEDLMFARGDNQIDRLMWGKSIAHTENVFISEALQDPSLSPYRAQRAGKAKAYKFLGGLATSEEKFAKLSEPQQSTLMDMLGWTNIDEGSTLEDFTKARITQGKYAGEEMGHIGRSALEDLAQSRELSTPLRTILDKIIKPEAQELVTSQATTKFTRIGNKLEGISELLDAGRLTKGKYALILGAMMAGSLMVLGRRPDLQEISNKSEPIETVKNTTTASIQKPVYHKIDILIEGNTEGPTDTTNILTSLQEAINSHIVSPIEGFQSTHINDQRQTMNQGYINNLAETLLTMQN